MIAYPCLQLGRLRCLLFPSPRLLVFVRHHLTCERGHVVISDLQVGTSPEACPGPHHDVNERVKRYLPTQAIQPHVSQVCKQDEYLKHLTYVHRKEQVTTQVNKAIYNEILGPMYIRLTQSFFREAKVICICNNYA